MSDTQSPRYASAPFNNPAGDIFLKSSDGVHFRVRSAILAEASPIFSDMMSVPQPPPKTSGPTARAATDPTLDGAPIVAVSEDSDTLDAILRLCYPTKDPDLTDLKAIRSVLAASLKYEMEEAASLMKKSLNSYLVGQPFRVWASSCILRLEEEAKNAATALLEKEIPNEAPPELDEISAGDYYRLETYHRAKGNVPETFKFCEPNPSDTEKSSGRRKRRQSEGTVVYQVRPYADIVCRSTDGVLFPSHRIILALASSVLSSRIAQLRSTPSDDDDNSSDSDSSEPDHPFSHLPVLNIDADSATLGPMLELCYARARTNVPYISSLGLGLTLAMARVARDCAMDSVLDILRFQAFWHSYAERPLAAYLVAARSGFPDWAADALPTLRGDLFAHGYVPEMESTPAVIYHRLMLNRRKSVAATSRLTGTSTPSPQASPARPASVAGVSGASQTSMKAPEGDLWLLGMSRQIADGLSQAASGVDTGRTIYRFDPNIKKILEESLSRKIWCHRCEPNVRIILGMRQMFDQVASIAYQHDVGGSVSASKHKYAC